MGTLDELCEILTWAQLGLHAKPVGLLEVRELLAAASWPSSTRPSPRASCDPAIAPACHCETDVEALVDALLAAALEPA